MPRAKLIVLTRDDAGNQSWAEVLSSNGFTVYCLPCIRTLPTNAQLPPLDGFDWLVFTSPRGVHYFADLIRPGTPLPRVAVIGPATSAAAIKSGLPVALKAQSPSSLSLSDSFPQPQALKVLLVRTTIASDTLPIALRRRGAAVAEFKAYRTVPIRARDATLAEHLASGRIGSIVFASPSAVAGFIGRAGGALTAAQVTPAIAIGPGVAQALSDAGFRDVRTAAAPTIKSVLELL